MRSEINYIIEFVETAYYSFLNIAMKDALYIFAFGNLYKMLFS